MTRLVDHYPETLRDIHDKVDSLLLDLELPAEFCAEVALRVTEWLRCAWGGRTLTYIWWQTAPTVEQDPQQAELITVAADPVCSARGQELRAAVWSILATISPHALGKSLGICHLATQTAVKVEAEWSRSTIYVPKAKEIDRLARDEFILNRFKWLGCIDTVIANTGLAQSQLYTIRRRMLKEEEAREQPPLPGLFGNP